MELAHIVVFVVVLNTGLILIRPISLEENPALFGKECKTKGLVQLGFKLLNSVGL